MNSCERYIKLIGQLEAGEISSADLIDLNLHAEYCTACRRKLDASLFVSETLAETEKPSADFTASVMSKIREDSKIIKAEKTDFSDSRYKSDSATRGKKKTKTLLRYAALAACLVLVVAVYSLFNNMPMAASAPKAAGDFKAYSAPAEESGKKAESETADDNRGEDKTAVSAPGVTSEAEDSDSAYLDIGGKLVSLKDSSLASLTSAIIVTNQSESSEKHYEISSSAEIVRLYELFSKNVSVYPSDEERAPDFYLLFKSEKGDFSFAQINIWAKGEDILFSDETAPDVIYLQKGGLGMLKDLLKPIA
ncbi:MAG: hypothetical protein GX684_02355 [Ruminococcaceae bacterium]|nr:hypothetical protein [Oscillospiraceae bacterium]